MRRLAYSEHSTNFVEVGYNEANDVCLLDFNVGYHQTPLDLSVETPHDLYGYGRIVPVDPSSHGNTAWLTLTFSAACRTQS